MEPEILDEPEVLETPAEEIVEPEAAEEPEVDERDAKIAELEEKNKKLFERAKKAEEAKKKEQPETAAPHYSLADLRAIQSVHEEDIDRLERFAKAEGLALGAAAKHPEWKAIEALRQEQRDSANAANVSNVRRGSTKVPDEVLVANASAGKLPDNDADIDRLVAAMSKRK